MKSVYKAAEVFVEGSTKMHLGTLSYVVPSNLAIHVGDLVKVPFGKKEAYGLVLGNAKDNKGTKEILENLGNCVGEVELDIANDVAKEHFSSINSLISRLYVKHTSSVVGLDDRFCKLNTEIDLKVNLPSSVKRRYYLRAPLLESAKLAAWEAERMSREGQVLVICPTKDMCKKVLSYFQTGAARLDLDAKKEQLENWQGFKSGTLRVGISTRQSILWTAENLKGIIIVEEDHPGHVEQSQPYTDTREIASLRAARQLLNYTLISSNPTAKGLGSKVKLTEVGTSRDWPSTAIIDRSEFSPGDRDIPESIRIELAQNSLKTKSIVIASSRPAERHCVKCNSLRRCNVCGELGCTHKDYEPCEECFEYKVKLVGWDVPRVSNDLKDLVEAGKVEVTTIDKLTTSKEGRLVVILSIDGALKIAGLSAELLATHLILKALESCGVGGKLLVATYEASNPYLVELLNNKNSKHIAQLIWNRAKENNLAPFSKNVKIRAKKFKPKTQGWPGKVFGPKAVGEDFEVLVRCSSEEMQKLTPIIEGLRKRTSVRVRVE